MPQHKQTPLYNDNAAVWPCIEIFSHKGARQKFCTNDELFDSAETKYHANILEIAGETAKI
jgi:hypothetical protein